MINDGLKIGICGGTFDPIHTGHLAVAELIRSEYGLERVLFIPSGKPPHKDVKSVTDALHRLNMVKNAVASNPFFEAVSLEIDREGYTYTLDTLQQLHGLYPENTEFYYIIGADVVMDLLTWKNAPEVFKLTRFIAVMRPGYLNEAFSGRISYLQTHYDIHIDSMEIPLFEISSTFIRERVKSKNSIKYLVEPSVEEYIIKNNLYL